MKWMGAALAFVALQLFFAAGLALSLDFHSPPPLLKYFNTAMVPVFGYVLWLGIRSAWSLRSLPENPREHLRSLDWSMVAPFFLAMCLIWLQFVALTWTKAMIPLASPMWADVPLANIEHFLLGVDAWRLLPAPGTAIDLAYMFWGLIICLAFTGLFLSRIRDREVSLLAFFLVVGLLGTFGQFLLPSGGPMFFERLGFGGRFADMQIPERAKGAGDMLWAAYQGHAIKFATGISAFPSIHVATTTWMAVAYRHWLAYLYLAVIYVGSIILGWHYAIDGIAGAVGALLCFRLAKAILGFQYSFGRTSNATASQR